MPAYQTIRELLSDQVEGRPDAPCLLHGDRCWSYAEFAAEVETVAHAFAALPLRPGQKVAILLPNCPEFLWTVFAMARTGGVFVPLNTAQTAGELQYLLAHSEARCLLTTDAFLPVIEGIRGDCPELEHVVTLDSGNGSDVMRWDEFIGATGGGPEPANVSPEDLASIIYTSGTTDRPKGVMLKHYAFAFAPSHRARALGWTQDDRVLVVMPLFHVNALCHMTIAMMSVGGVVVLKDRFSASRFWDDVRTHGVTTSSIMQTIPRILLNLPPDPGGCGHAVEAGGGTAAPGRPLGVRTAFRRCRHPVVQSHRRPAERSRSVGGVRTEARELRRGHRPGGAPVAHL